MSKVWTIFFCVCASLSCLMGSATCAPGADSVQVILGELGTDQSPGQKEGLNLVSSSLQGKEMALSIEQLVALAVEHNRSLKIFRTLEQAATINLKQAEYSFLPSLYVPRETTAETMIWDM